MHMQKEVAMTAASMLFPALLMAICDVRMSVTAHEHVDLIELNHFYDDLGRHVYDQVIFYEWAPDQKEFHVRAWCLVDPKECPNCQPWSSQDGEQWHVRWYDKDHRLVRQLDADHFRETWTQIDPERANKKKLDEKLRTALIQLPNRAPNGLTARR